jgi:hydroxymethylbilane synthase
VTRPWRIATRRSALAVAQAGHVRDALAEATGRPAELVPMATTGDEQPDRAITAFDAKGVFVDRTREAVLSGDCDLVVHSYKDLPTAPAEGLVVGAVPRRADPRDLFVTREGLTLSRIPRTHPFTIGTSSQRRRAQLMKARRDLIVQPLRGNLDTRLRRVADGDLDAVVVALAGVQRLGPVEHAVKAVPLEPGEVLNAPAQGALALEVREDDADTRAALLLLDDDDDHLCVRAERSMLAALAGGCTAPIGALARIIDHGSGAGSRRVELLGMVADPNGHRLLRASHQAAATQVEELGRTLAATLLSNGADEILAALDPSGQ